MIPELKLAYNNLNQLFKSARFSPWSPSSLLIYRPYVDAAIVPASKPSSRKTATVILAGLTSTASTGVMAVTVNLFPGTIGKELWLETLYACVDSRAVLVFRIKHVESGFIVPWGGVHFVRISRMGTGRAGEMGLPSHPRIQCRFLILGKVMGLVCVFLRPTQLGIRRGHEKVAVGV
jgi:hypothetical protein